MNRNKSVGLSKKIGNNRQSNINQRDPFDIMRADNFGDFDSQFDHFGMNFGGGFESMFRAMSRGFDDMNSDMFSNLESMSRQNMPGSTVIQKSYVSKVNYNQNGQTQKETFKSQSIKQIDSEGKKIQEKQQAYENTGTGIQKAAHERRFNEKGHKIIKERNRNTGDEMEHTIFKGISENEYDNFNNEYNEYRNKVNFQNNYEYLNLRRALPNNNNDRRNNQSNSNLNTNINQNQRNFRALPDNYNSRR